MASEAQIEANRRNAQRSTGPRSIEGKQKASQNALKHGLAATRTVLCWEDKDEFESLLESYRASYCPETPVELTMLNQLAHAAWSLQRAHGIEKAIFDRTFTKIAGCETGFASDMQRQSRGYQVYTDEQAALNQITRYQAHLERSFYRALKELRAEIRQRPQITKQSQPPESQPENFAPRPTQETSEITEQTQSQTPPEQNNGDNPSQIHEVPAPIAPDNREIGTEIKPESKEPRTPAA